MADNVEITAGSGTTVAADDIGGVLHQRVKVEFGADGVAADVTSTNPFPVHLASFATIPVAVGTHSVLNAGGSLSAYQGGGAWLTTLATLPVVTNVTGYALESGGNLDSIVTTLNSIKSKTDNLDVTLGSRLGSGATLPITGTISALNAGGSLTAFQGSAPWLVTFATLPGIVSVNNSSIPVTQSGTWTVQPGNTPNTIAWLVTMATLPVVANVSVAAQATVTAIQGDPGTKAWLATFATLSAVSNVLGKYLPTLASLPDQGYVNLPVDLFGNLKVNENVALPNSTRLNRFYTLASMASLMAAPGTGKRLVIREMDFSGNATVTVQLYEDHAGTPVSVWGPHYFLPYAGFIKPQCYIPITANKSLGINITGSAFNSTLDIRIETENV